MNQGDVCGNQVSWFLCCMPRIHSSQSQHASCSDELTEGGLYLSSLVVVPSVFHGDGFLQNTEI